MHPTKHATIFSAVLLAIVAAIFLRETIAVAGAGNGQPRQTQNEVRIGTVDLYLISERIMQQPALVRIREEADQPHMARLQSIEDELRRMEAQLGTLQQNDPQVQQILTRAQSLQTDYQQIQQQRQQELERINSRQLIDAVRQTRSAAREVANRRGYTHVFANRSFERPIETETVGATLQEMLARPILVGVPEDDITSAILDLMDLVPPAQPAQGQDGQGRQDGGAGPGGGGAPGNQGPRR